MAHKPYFDRWRIIITRPTPQAKPWRAELKAKGVNSVAVAVMEIEPVALDVEKQAVKNLILEFDNYQKAIFVSQNAVRYGLEWLDRYWPQLPEGVSYYAIGSTTARVLEAEGLSVTAADSTMNSEELLQLLDADINEGDKILIFRGCGGRPVLGEELEGRGCRVDYAELYYRKLPQNSQQELEALALAEGDILSVHSGESLENLVQLLVRSEVADWAELPILVPGKRVAAMAESYGFSQIISAENASDKSMYAALKNWCQQQADSSKAE